MLVSTERMCRLPAVVVAAFVCFGLSVPASAQTSTVREPLNAALIECQKHFRLAEIDSQVPHAPGTMREVCSTVEQSCAAGYESASDCVKATASMRTSVSNAFSARAGRSKPPK